MNTGKNIKHTLVGIGLVKKLSEEGKNIFTIQDARKIAPECGIMDSYVVESLHHLSNTGWVFRLKKGLYSISSSFPGVPPTHEFEVATALVHPSAISHWSALHFHGMTEQIPQRVYVTTTKAMNFSRSTKGGQRDSSTEINGVLYEFQRSSNLLKSLIRNSAFGQPLFCGMAEILKNNLKFIRPLNRSPIWLIR